MFCTFISDISNVVVSVLALSAEGRRFDPQPGQTKDMKLVSAASPLSTRHLGVRAKTESKVRILCLGEVERLPVECCFRELAR